MRYEKEVCFGANKPRSVIVTPRNTIEDYAGKEIEPKVMLSTLRPTTIALHLVG